MVEAREKGKELAERDVLPDFDFRFAYGLRDDGPGRCRPQGPHDRNGRDQHTHLLPAETGPRRLTNPGRTRAARKRATVPPATRCSTWWPAWGPWCSAWNVGSSSIRPGSWPRRGSRAESTMSSYAVNKGGFQRPARKPHPAAPLRARLPPGPHGLLENGGPREHQSVPNVAGRGGTSTTPSAYSGETWLTSMNGERRLRLSEKFMDAPGRPRPIA